MLSVRVGKYPPLWWKPRRIRKSVELTNLLMAGYRCSASTGLRCVAEVISLQKSSTKCCHRRWISFYPRLYYRGFSARLVVSIWCFFALIITSTYTANLAAFLTTQRMESPIKNVEDLAKQDKVKFGCLKGGATYNFFKVSWHELESFTGILIRVFLICNQFFQVIER